MFDNMLCELLLNEKLSKMYFIIVGERSISFFSSYLKFYDIFFLQHPNHGVLLVKAFCPSLLAFVAFLETWPRSPFFQGRPSKKPSISCSYVSHASIHFSYVSLN